MALLATNRFAGDGVTTSYEFNFAGKYIARDHVKVYQEDNATQARMSIAITDNNFLNDTTLRNLPVTPAGKTLVIYRDTPKPPLVAFTNGAHFTAHNMDLVARQGLFVAMEAMDSWGVDAREQLLAAVAVAKALVEDAMGAVSEATAAALAAAISASNAAASASAAEAARMAAETAHTSAAGAATNAAVSAGEANAILSIQGRMCCRVVVADAVNRVLRLERCGGQSMSINGAARIIPAAGVTLTVAPNAEPSYLYAGWNAGNIGLIEDAVLPVFSRALGQWIHPGLPEYVPVAYFRGDSLSQPNRFLRNYYNAGAPAFVDSLLSDYIANWDGVGRQLVTAGILLLPGDTVEAVGQASILSTPDGRVGDMAIKLESSVLASARNTHAGGPHIWHNYHCGWAIQRGVSDPPREAVFELVYFPISTTGSTWTALGYSSATRLIIRVTPYKWA